ncbi:MAG: LUD domain-containing protein, partial [Thermodesulfobacteriota bacterium]
MGFQEVRFEKDSEKAIQNKPLQKALVNVTDRFRTARNKASTELPNWEELRSEAREIKKKTIENLDKYLIMLEENVLKAGGKVHWAKDADEASHIVVKIAQDRNVKSVVKSKSMATEEIELNSSFEDAGIKVVETDL